MGDETELEKEMHRQQRRMWDEMGRPNNGAGCVVAALLLVGAGKCARNNVCAGVTGALNGNKISLEPLCPPSPKEPPKEKRRRDCSDRKHVATINGIKVWHLPNDPPALVYEGGLKIDADGAPDAYHPYDPWRGKGEATKGRDYPANGGIEPTSTRGEIKINKEKNIPWGIEIGEDGKPLIQLKGDVAPGYYVSQTSLSDEKATGQRKYIDASKVLYVAVPQRFLYHPRKNPKGLVHKGDFAIARNAKTGDMAFAIVADGGPEDKVGEGSIALADVLTVRSSPKNGGVASGIQYVIFPGSARNPPWPVAARYEDNAAEVKKFAEEKFEEWGGREVLKDCF